MGILKILLSTEYTSKPAHCKIYCCEELIFDSIVLKDVELIHKIELFNQFNIKIIKTGKTVDIVKKKEKQDIIIKNINLNGIDLKIKEFGEFKIKNNIYVDDHTLNTNLLNLNGEWNLELPYRELVGQIDVESIKIRDNIEDSDIACFGCSQTYGSFLEYNESWPNQLKLITGKKIRNYGIGGSNINEITAFVDYYIKNYKTDMILLYLPHTFRRQKNIDGRIKRIGTTDSENRELMLHGEEHSIAVLSIPFYNWLENISNDKKIYFGTYQTSEYELYKKTPLTKFMLPFLEGNNYPTASDNIHHGPEFNKDFAKLVFNFLKDRRSKDEQK